MKQEPHHKTHCDQCIIDDDAAFIKSMIIALISVLLVLCGVNIGRAETFTTQLAINVTNDTITITTESGPQSFANTPSTPALSYSITRNITAQQNELNQSAINSINEALKSLNRSVELGSVSLSESTLAKIKEQYASDIQAQQEYITNTLAPLIREKEGLITKIAELEKDSAVEDASEGTTQARLDAKDAQIKAKDTNISVLEEQRKLWLSAATAEFAALCAIIGLLLVHQIGIFDKKTRRLTLGLEPE